MYLNSSFKLLHIYEGRYYYLKCNFVQIIYVVNHLMIDNRLCFICIECLCNKYFIFFETGEIFLSSKFIRMEFILDFFHLIFSLKYIFTRTKLIINQFEYNFHSFLTIIFYNRKFPF